MNLVPGLFALASVLAFAGGYLPTPEIDDAGLDAGIRTPMPPAPHSPRLDLAAARAALSTARLNSPAAPAAPDPNPEPAPDPPPRASPPPAPAPVDVAVRLRTELAAVVRDQRGPSLLLIDGTESRARRALRPGERYRDGWQLQTIEAGDIVLRKGGATKRVPISLAATPPETSVSRAVEGQSADPPRTGVEAPKTRRRITRSGRG